MDILGQVQLVQAQLGQPQLEIAPIGAPPVLPQPAAAQQQEQGPVIPERKHCGGCGNVKASDEFHKSKSRGDGLQSHCKECMARLHTNWRNKRPEVTAPAVASKVCGGCKKEKPASEFYADRKRKDGLQCQCKACTAQHHERWRAKKRAELAGHMASEKTCRACGETKEADEFCRDTRSPDGLQSRCKACYQIYFSLWSANKKAQRAPGAGGEAAPSGHKVCATCGVEKALEEFKVSRSKTTDDGRAGSCMECSKRKTPKPAAQEKRKKPKSEAPPLLEQSEQPAPVQVEGLPVEALMLAAAAQQQHQHMMMPPPPLEAAEAAMQGAMQADAAAAELDDSAQQLDDPAQQAPKKRRRKAIKARAAAQSDNPGMEDMGGPIANPAALGFLPGPGGFSGAMAEALASAE